MFTLTAASSAWSRIPLLSESYLQCVSVKRLQWLRVRPVLHFTNGVAVTYEYAQRFASTWVFITAGNRAGSSMTI
jgi:hypothetical protein